MVIYALHDRIYIINICSLYIISYLLKLPLKHIVPMVSCKDVYFVCIFHLLAGLYGL